MLKDVFKIAAQLSEAEVFLQKEGIEYQHRGDGTIFVPGDIGLAGRGLTKLPDLSSVHVGGHFYCSNNQLTSLVGAPQKVGGNFWCRGGQLTSLLTSLVGAPQNVGGSFACDSNRLISLVGAPQTVGRYFWCHDNQLPDLYGGPHTFEELQSDFGTFTSWDEIPDDVKMSAQTKQRLEEKVMRDVHDAMYNSPAMPFKPPPRRKRPEV